jgi:hypothetical protein
MRLSSHWLGAFRGGILLLLIPCAAICATGWTAEPKLKNWKTSTYDSPKTFFQIRGSESRNNPLRRALEEPFAGDELFLHFHLQYSAESIDLPTDGNGEFFVLWFDEVEGGDGAGHAGGIPNVGIHVVDDENRFMVRFAAEAEKFTPTKLAGGRDYWIVARLWKSVSGQKRPFDALDIWVDPKPAAEFKPHACVTSSQSIDTVSWIGFSTGRKTEIDDRILVSDVSLATNWKDLARGEAWERDALDTFEPEETTPPERTVRFVDDVLPVLTTRCFSCHAGEDPESGKRLDNLDDLLSSVSPGSSGRSLLFDRLTTDDLDLRMPPHKSGPPLGDRELDVIARWIDEGVEWDERRLPSPVPTTNHWAFQAIVRPAVPDTDDLRWAGNPVDAFASQKHRQLNLNANQAADREALLRRIALDLTGLTPVANEPLPTNDAEIDAWIDQLLLSQAYGERWGRHWLDVARYAESNGHQHNRDRRHAWRYRQYVIDAFRNHVPFDRFLREQIAGGESDEAIVATGFLAATRYSGNELDKRIQRNDMLIDVTNAVGNAVMGLTMECAQCHSHKFDPISLRDYYRFQAFFVDGQPGNVVLGGEQPPQQSEIDQRWKVFDDVRRRRTRNLRRRGYPEPVLVIPTAVVRGMTKQELAEFDRLNASIAKLPQAWAWHDTYTANPVAPHNMRWPLPRRDYTAEVHVLGRGDINSPGPAVMSGWPAVFGQSIGQPLSQSNPGDEVPAVALDRNNLVDWLVSPENPLTARVWANRIWQWHFGRGLVATSGDFGTQGSEPTHRELLDWLAAELIESGWNTQHIQRLILQSQTYRLSSAPSAANEELDNDNRFLWRHRPRRLEAELIRDNMFLVAGLLDRQVGGPSVPISEAPTSGRRSIYIQQKRDLPLAHMELFDGARGNVSCSRRSVSTVPLQSLYLLNGKATQDLATAWAKKLRHKRETTEDQVRLACHEAWGRDADGEELARGIRFVEQADLEQFCLVLLNTSEFLYTR